MIELEQTREKAILVTVDTGSENCDALLDELEELADTAGAQTVGRVIQKMECYVTKSENEKKCGKILYFLQGICYHLNELLFFCIVL